MVAQMSDDIESAVGVELASAYLQHAVDAQWVEDSVREVSVCTLGLSLALSRHKHCAAWRGLLSPLRGPRRQCSSASGWSAIRASYVIVERVNLTTKWRTSP